MRALLQRKLKPASMSLLSTAYWNPKCPTVEQQIIGEYDELLTLSYNVCQRFSCWIVAERAGVVAGKMRLFLYVPASLLRSGRLQAAFIASMICTSDATAQRAAVDEQTLPAVEVIASRRVQDSTRKPPSDLDSKPTTSEAAADATAASASEKTFSGDDVNARPFSRPAEALEVVPGLIVTQHSGEGKANQYFLRGFNLDHGTDLAISVDGMPVNMRTHGHGQGYADLNFLIPELIGSVSVKKGPYFADEGDFSSAGSVHIDFINRISKTYASTTVGSFGYRRALGITSTKFGEGTLLVAGEAGTYNGPWENPDRSRKLNGVIRYSQGTAENGFSLTGMAYSNRWNSTDQIPLRAIASGQVGLYGALDPSDGGNSDRFSISGRWRDTDRNGASKVDFYAIKSSLDLYNNFTFFLSDPVNGDQFHQRDDRVLAGLNASHTFNSVFAGLPMQTEVGIQSRYDDIKVALSNTVQRQFLSGTRSDKVKEGSVGIFIQNTVYWTDWLRTNVGYRGDFYTTKVNSLLNQANSGNAAASIGSPKVGAVFGPFAKTEFFINAGEGFHSNDARGVTIKESPSDGSAVDPSPFLVKTRGAEIGVRTKIIPGLTSSVSLFMLDSNSEILFVGDAGDTEASRPSRRVGIEWTKRLPARVLASTGRRHRHHAREIPWRECRSGRDLCVACRLSAGPDRKRAGQSHPRSAKHDSVGRDQAWRKNRMVFGVTLPLFRTTILDRRRCVQITGDRFAEWTTGLPIRQWVAPSARRLQFAQQ